jgi:hypothetical protein
MPCTSMAVWRRPGARRPTELIFVDTPSAVDITVLIDGIPAVSVQDTSPYRLTQGDSLGFLCGGAHAASWDKLSVTVIPEPAACALLLLGFALWLPRRPSRCQLLTKPKV